MLTVDLLHEVELGVWKALLTHLIRMLHVCGAGKVHEFDERYASFCTCAQMGGHVYHLPVFEWLLHLVTQSAGSRGTSLT